MVLQALHCVDRGERIALIVSDALLVFSHGDPFAPSRALGAAAGVDVGKYGDGASANLFEGFADAARKGRGDCVADRSAGHHNMVYLSSRDRPP